MKRAVKVATRNELKALMLDVSERYLHGWKFGIEYVIWGMVKDSGKRDSGLVTQDSVTRLKLLSRSVKGWWAWDDEAKDHIFVGMKQWKEMYHKWITS